jgi:hypothetical protein
MFTPDVSLKGFRPFMIKKLLENPDGLYPDEIIDDYFRGDHRIVKINAIQNLMSIMNSDYTIIPGLDDQNKTIIRLNFEKRQKNFSVE